MNATTKGKGLDANAPKSGALLDCYEVADTATMLAARILGRPLLERPDGWYPRTAARHAAELHRISGRLHRIGEQECNGTRVPCSHCGGEGTVRAPEGGHDVKCPRCKGDGSRQDAPNMRANAEEIAAFYGLRCYFQTDPRGCALWLMDPSTIPADLSRYLWESERATGIPRGAADSIGPTRDAILRDRWIEANYTSGHAVCRIGR